VQNFTKLSVVVHELRIYYLCSIGVAAYRLMFNILALGNKVHWAINQSINQRDSHKKGKQAGTR